MGRDLKLIQAIFEHVWVAIESISPRWTINPQSDSLPAIDFLWWFLTVRNIVSLKFHYGHYGGGGGGAAVEKSDTIFLERKAKRSQKVLFEA